MMTISILDIINSTTVDGPGFRTSIYCAGCPHKCKGCHNPKSWDINEGRRITTDEVVDCILAQSMENVTFSGGDPMFQMEEFTDIAQKIKSRSTKNIWCYTGFKFEQLISNEKARRLLSHIDTLVDGKYCEEWRDTSLRFRGSSNQRIIDVQKSLIAGEVVMQTLTNTCKWLD